MRPRCAIPTAIALAAALALAGVAGAADPPRMYLWSSYERDMFDAYERPDDEERQLELAATLLRIIRSSDEAGRKPPPGVVAEYGWVLFRRGELYAAIDHFRREATLWPESEKLMERLIRRAQEEAAR